MSGAIGFLLAAINLAVLSVLAWALASTHPAPAQTGYIPFAIFSGLGAVICFLFSCGFFLIGLFL